MSRKIVPGNLYHLIARFVGGQWFIKSEVERHGYMSLLGGALLSTDWRCFAFAVMSNHVHLGVLAGDERVGAWTARVHKPFADWINGREDRHGYVLSRGPKTIAVRDEGAAPLIAYIHRNPVRAGVVDHAAASTWTSHAALLGQAERPPWLDVELALELAGFRSGGDFGRWFDANDVSRAQLAAFDLEPPRPVGRPRTAEAVWSEEDEEVDPFDAPYDASFAREHHGA